MLTELQGYAIVLFTFLVAGTLGWLFAKFYPPSVPSPPKPGQRTYPRRQYPILEDSTWDWEGILAKHHATVTPSVYKDQVEGYALNWKPGCMHLATDIEPIARKAAGLFISLWLKDISASFCDKLVDGYIDFLERQERFNV